MTKRKRKITRVEEAYCGGCFEKESDIGLLKPCSNREYEFLDNEEPEPLYCASCWNREMEFRRKFTNYKVSYFGLTVPEESDIIGESDGN